MWIKRTLLVLSLCIGQCFSAYAQTPPPDIFTTPYDPRIPNFAKVPTREAVQDGQWHEPATWSDSQVPTESDIVKIDSHTVQYCTDHGTALTLQVVNGGKLTFCPTKNTVLKVHTLMVVQGGILEIGTNQTPIPEGIKAEVLLRDVPLVTAPTTTGVYDPSQYAGGILILDSTLSIVGAQKLPTFVRLAKEPQLGESTLQVSQPVSSWKNQDELIIPDSRQLTAATVKTPSQVELVKLSQISQQTLTLAQPLAFAHPGAKNSLTGALDFTPHVGNMTRNVLIRSENPQGVRGHIWVSRKSTYNVKFARFEHLGRTTTAKMHNTTYTPLGQILQLGTNQQGRYTMHMHHVNGQPSGQPYQFVMQGNVFYGGMTPHNFKWMVGLHDTHYGLIRDNLMVGCAGACLITEDGSETANLIENNFAVKATGTGDRMGLGSEATGFWFRGTNNTVRKNVAASLIATGPGVQHCGYTIFQQGTGTVKVPISAGVDTSIKTNYTLQSAYVIPIREFADNEVYNAPCGMTAWWVGAEYLTPKATQDSVVKNLRAWNILTSAWYNYHSHRLVIDGLVVRGDPKGFGCCNTGYQGLDYFASDLTIKNADIQGVREGILVSTATAGTQHIYNSHIVAAKTGIAIGTLWTSGYNTKALRPRSTFIENVFMEPIPGSTGFHTIDLQYSTTGVKTLIRPDQVEVKDYQQEERVDFRVYYLQQDPSFIIPQSVLNADGTPKLEAAPQAGMTNTQALSTHDIAIAGEIAPCLDKTSRPEILGFTCSGATIQP